MHFAGAFTADADAALPWMLCLGKAIVYLFCAAFKKHGVKSEFRYASYFIFAVLATKAAAGGKI